MDINFNYFIFFGLFLSLLLCSRLFKVGFIATLAYWATLTYSTIFNNQLFDLTDISWSRQFNIQFALNLDALALVFISLISLIGLFIFLYSYFYANNIKDKMKLISLLNFFAVSMIGVTSSDNMITTILWWEFTSISSYLLIQYDSKDADSNQAAFNSLFVSIIGGLCLLTGFILAYSYFGSWSLQGLNNVVITNNNQTILTVIFALIFVGAITKSAQFPFHFWLPQAMKAPTPVSAYLHSATMVNLGIYLLARLHHVFSQLECWYLTISTAAMLTIIISSISILFQKDLKAIFAYSTLFILGNLFYLLGGTHWQSAEAIILLLIFHALYKASGFMAVGTIDKTYQTRDIDKLHGIGRSNVKLGILIAIPLIAMAGLPPVFGFVMKEVIYESKLVAPSFSPLYVAINLIASAMIAAISIKLLYLFYKKPATENKQSKTSMLAVLVPINIMVILFGLCANSLKHYVISAANIITEDMNISYMNPNSVWSTLLSILTVVLGLVVAYLIIKKPTIINKKLPIPAANAVFLGLLNKMLTLGKIFALSINFENISFYLKLSLVFLVALLSLSLFQGNFISLSIKSNQDLMQIIILSVLAISALSLLYSNNVFINIVSLSIFGLVISLYFIASGALDVAMTQIIIEVLSLIIIVFTLKKHQKTPSNSKNYRGTVIALILSVLITLALLQNLNLPFNTVISDYYIQNSVPLAYGKNVVNVILVDFRAFDTFGEVLVVLGACILIFELIKNKVFFRK